MFVLLLGMFIISIFICLSLIICCLMSLIFLFLFFIHCDYLKLFLSLIPFFSSLGIICSRGCYFSLFFSQLCNCLLYLILLCYQLCTFVLNSCSYYVLQYKAVSGDFFFQGQVNFRFLCYVISLFVWFPVVFFALLLHLFFLLVHSWYVLFKPSFVMI